LTGWGRKGQENSLVKEEREKQKEREIIYSQYREQKVNNETQVSKQGEITLSQKTQTRLFRLMMTGKNGVKNHIFENEVEIARFPIF